jgi:tetratricopeptide (TPR) repeat protein
MNTAEATTQLAALAQRARAEGADAAVVSEVLTQMQAIAGDESLSPGRALVEALLNAAGALVAAGPPGPVEALFMQAQRVLNASSDARIDDQLVLWHNLGALYDKHGATQLVMQTLGFVLQVAERYDGPLTATGAQVFSEHALIYQRNGRTEPMLTLMRQYHRYRTGADQSPGDRVSWLEMYASILLNAGRVDEVEPVIEQGVDLAHALGDADREASLLMSRARVAVARNDVAAAVAALDRARPVIEHPALSQTTRAVSVWLTLASQLLNQGAKERYVEVGEMCEKAIVALRALKRDESHEFAYALYLQACVTEYLGDRASAARRFRAAAAIPGAEKSEATDWLSHAGRAWFDAGEWDAASQCYLDAVRRRV